MVSDILFHFMVHASDVAEMMRAVRIQHGRYTCSDRNYDCLESICWFKFQLSAGVFMVVNFVPEQNRLVGR